jgi:hypothetical protein
VSLSWRKLSISELILIGSILDWRIPVDNIWACKIIPSLIIASCFVALTWNPWENYVSKANIQGRGIRIKGETAYIVGMVSERRFFFDHLTNRFGK